MKISAFILCFNESLMIRHTINYYSKFCSDITILNNNSTDNSIEIVKKEYPNVKIKNFGAENSYREDILTEIRNNCWKNSDADYVIVCDMDEFLYSQDMDNSLKLLEKYRPAICSVVGYEMFSKKFPKNNKVSLLDQVKHGLRNYRFDKTIIFNPKKVKHINYDYGAHSCSPEFYDKKAEDFLIEFKLLHFKYLGKKYLYKKHFDYMNRLSKINIQNKWGAEYKEGKKHIDRKFKIVEKHIFKIIP
ncbi:glycosyl transferase family 2 [Hanstruepera neustonica]|uniref:Glycosyl transferase family 2 n=1 Tax=Hanstruepera neustonica TaxID=1445657 RepID=A0A2K1E4W9_9FLAO|nr:glycosyltransferase family 2 protein [Hanstruepera neustonica]PNQ75327.1 glycosyl transferase family 2 [Hanstruepera neustonica]